MPSREQVHYFGAGPAPLPTAVLERASKALLNYNDLGIGLTEISHRSAHAARIIADAKSALTELLSIPDGYEILFLQGGGSGQFSASVYYMTALWVERRRAAIEQALRHGKGADGDDVDKQVFDRLKLDVREKLRLDYVVTGSWSLKASQEAARLVGAEHVHVAADSRKSAEHGGFGAIPPERDWALSSAAGPDSEPAMVYYCDNETVDGVEFPGFPAALAGLPVVADMSSNLLSRRVDVSKYAVIFGGAQKNVGSTGVTIVIVRKSILPPHAAAAAPSLLRRLGLPTGPLVLDWSTMAKNDSLYNTLPIFDVWIAGQVMGDSVKTYGQKGVVGQEEVANQKADRIYAVLDRRASLYTVVPDKAVRSRMNICFRLRGGEAQEKGFLQAAEAEGLMGLKGHRSVGGIRISNYNAVTTESVDKLVAFLDK